MGKESKSHHKERDGAVLRGCDRYGMLVDGRCMVDEEAVDVAEEKDMSKVQTEHCVTFFLPFSFLLLSAPGVMISGL